MTDHLTGMLNPSNRFNREFVSDSQMVHKLYGDMNSGPLDHSVTGLFIRYLGHHLVNTKSPVTGCFRYRRPTVL